MLTYEELSTIIPKETKDFLDIYLPLEYHYIRNCNVVPIKKSTITHPESKRFFLMLYSYCLKKENALLFSQFGFQTKSIPVEEDIKGDLEMIYMQNPTIIPSFKNKEDYSLLTPIDIILKAYKEYESKETTSILFTFLLPRLESESKFLTFLKKQNVEEKERIELLLEKELFNNFPISVISYLETASKIRKYIKEEKKEDKELTKDNNLIPLSLFFAIYFYQDPITDTNGITMQKVIIYYLEKKGITLNQISSQLDLYLYKDDIDKIENSLIGIKEYYQKYYDNHSRVEVVDIVNNLWNRKVTESIYLERLFAQENCYFEMFQNFLEDIQKEYEFIKRKSYEKKLSSFYSNMNLDTKEFIETTSKIYLLLLDKMKEEQHKKEVLEKEDDADTLALLIASFYYQTEVSKYYEDNSITLEKILDYLKITITKEEIKKVELNPIVLMNRFNRFIREGVNSRKKIESITVNDISYNLCNRDFNKSLIMEKLFHELSDGKALSNNFLLDLKGHLQQKERDRINQLKQSFFGNMPIETIHYLEDVSIIFKSLQKEGCLELTKKEKKQLSLLVGFFGDDQLTEFMDYLQIDLEEIESYFDIDLSNIEGEYDIDFLVKEFTPFLGEEEKKKELTPYQILINAFSKENNRSYHLSSLLDHLELPSNLLETIDSKVEDYKDYQEQQEEKKYLQVYHINTIHSLEKMLHLYEFIKNKNTNWSQEEICELSLLIISYDSSLIKQFLEKHQISFNRILKLYDLEKIKEINYLNDPNYHLIEPFKKYLEKDSNSKKSIRDIKDICKVLFDEEISHNKILKSLLEEEEYEKLKREILTEKDYESSLTIKERISLLQTKEIPSIDRNNIESILEFGKELVPHSQYIYDELPRLVEEDQEKNTLQSIEEIVNSLYQKEDSKKTKGIFMKFFSSREEEPEIRMNQDKIEELRITIEENITVLSRELLGYDAIRKYMEEYRKKNLSYLEIATKEVELLEENLQVLNPENEEEYFLYLKYASLLQIMKDKKNRFQTTNRITSQELVRISQAIVNHFITINALEMAKNDLFPLIASELAIAKGRNTEKEALELSQGVINLFQALLTRNVEEASNHLELLNHSNLSVNLLSSLQTDIISFTKNIAELKELDRKASNFKVDDFMEEQGKSLQKRKK